MLVARLGARRTASRRLLPLFLVAACCAVIGAGMPRVRAAATVARLQVSAPVSSTAGSSFAVTVTAQDAGGATVSGYTGTVRFSSSDSAASVQSSYTFSAGDHGTKTFASAVNLRTAGSQTLTVSDATNGVGGTATIDVKAGPAAKLALNGPSSAQAGADVSFTLSANDFYSNPATGYRGTVRFSSNDGGATLPPNYTFTSADAGQHSFNVSFSKSGSVSLTAADTGSGGPSSASANVSVGSPGSASSGSSSASAGSAGSTAPAPRTSAARAAGAASGGVTQFAITTDLSGSATAGQAINITITAEDGTGATVGGYSGTVHFTSSDGQAVLPGDATFAAGDNGVKTFSGGVTFKSSGSQTVTATDTGDSTVTGTLAPAVTVNAAAADHLSLGLPANVSANIAFSATVTAKDQFGNTVPGFADAVHLASSDGAATLPQDYTFAGGDGGQHGFSLVLRTPGSRSVSASDTAQGSSVTGDSQSVPVGNGPVAAFDVSVPTSAAAGTPFNATITALDAQNHPVSGYLGTIHFASSDSDPAVVVPANYTFTAGDAGSATFFHGVTLQTAGNQTLAVTDANNGGIGGNATVDVDAGQAVRFQVQAPASVIAGVPFSVTVTALDATDNIATNYRGTASLGSGDRQATLPPGHTFTVNDNGVFTFSADVQLRTAGTQTLTASDGANSGITGQTGVSVTASAVAVTGGSISGMESTATGGVTVATFSDTGCTAPTDYTASIDWGDGTSPTAGTIAGQCGSLSVQSSGHTYTSDGTFHPAVTITKVSSGTAAQGSATATIADAPISAYGGVQLSGSEGTALSNVAVASFTDSAGPHQTSTYSATIDWGDGSQPSAGTIALAGSEFSVSGTHSYAEEGHYTIHVHVQDDGGAAADATSSAAIADAPLTAGASRPFSAVEGTAYSGPIASFTDTGGAEPSQSYTITIDWGDGTPSDTQSGTVTASGNTLTVHGTHTYAGEGNYSLNISVTDEGGSGVQLSATAHVSDAPLSGGAVTVHPVEGQNFSGVVATFSDTGGAEWVGNYQATIDWGDGSAATAGVVATASHGFTISGSHTYTASGNATISVLVGEEGGSSVAIVSSAVVGDAPLTVDGSTPSAITATVAVPWSGIVAAFVDAGGVHPASSYQAMIDWGDGSTPSAGTVTAAGSVLSVSGAHTFSAIGTLTVSVSIGDGGGSTLSVRTPAVVQSPPAPAATSSPTPSPTPVTVIILPPTATPAPTPAPTPTGSTGGSVAPGLLQVLDGSGAPSQMLLTAGCNVVTISAPGGTAMSTIAAMVEPQRAILAIWRFNNATKQFDSGYFADANAPTDFSTTMGNEGSYQICVAADATIASNG